MSINALTSKDTDKGWANLYVNTLTAYNGLTVNGPTKIGPAEKKTITFTALFPADKDPINLVVRNVGGLINAEVEAFTHNGPTSRPCRTFTVPLPMIGCRLLRPWIYLSGSTKEMPVLWVSCV